MGRRRNTIHSILDRLVVCKPSVLDTGCWEYPGYCGEGGYCLVQLLGKMRYIHRLSYEYFIGPIPEGLEVDHLCFNKKCANPEHLEAVTPEENTRRRDQFYIREEKVNCPKGHPYNEENTYHSPDGTKKCRICHKEQERQSRERRRSLPSN